MEITLNQYIMNPMGKTNAVMSAASREFMRMKYRKKFENIMLRENGKLEHYMYKGPNNTYWIYAKIPSEVVKKFYYDVIIKFYAGPDVKSGGKNLFDYNIQFFSNDPAFVYTYANVFTRNNLFVKELASKMSREALREKPKEKNPKDNVGYIKSLMFTYLLMENRKLNKVDIFTKQAEQLNLPFLLSNIEDADKKISERQELGAQVSQRKKIEVDKDTIKKIKSIGVDLSDKSKERLAVRTTNTVGKIKNSNMVNSIKTTKKVKRK